MTTSIQEPALRPPRRDTNETGNFFEQALSIRDCQAGKGVFTSQFLDEGLFIMEFKGPLFTREDNPEGFYDECNYYLQIGENLYMGAGGGMDDYINHACNPNTALFIDGESVFLVALRDIQPGEELTYDYSTTMGDGLWECDCLCGCPECRRRIRDFICLPIEIQDHYIQRGIVPQYILDQRFNPPNSTEG